MHDRTVDRRRLLVPVAVQAVYSCVVGVFDHILHGFSRITWIAGQTCGVVAGLAVVCMTAQDIRPVESGVAAGAGLGISLAQVFGVDGLIDLHAMVD